MFDLGRLRALHAVATEGSVVAAATALGYTPSAVSQQLARLEREAGVALLERDGRGVRLTEAGHLLSGHAAEVLRRVEMASSALERHVGEVSGRLALGAFATAARTLVPPVLATFRRSYPQVDLRFLEVDPHLSGAALLRGDLDVVVTHGWVDVPLEVPDAVVVEDLGVDEADLVVPADHPFAGRTTIDEAAMMPERWVASPPGTVCHDWLLQAARRCGVTLELSVSAAEYATQFAMVEAGLGVALVPRLSRPALPSTLRALPVVPSASRVVSVAVRRSSADRPAVTVAVAALREAWEAHRLAL